MTNNELPLGWVETALGALGSVGSSKRVHQQDWKSEGVPFFRAREIAELSRNGTVDNDLFISEELFQELSKEAFVPSSGDVMITGVGTIGVPYVVKEKDRFYFKDASVLIFKNDHGLESRYLFFFLKSKSCQQWIKEGSTGTTVDTLTIGRAREIPIPLAPLAEQKRIADKLEAVLGRVDACRARLDRVPDLLKRFRQSVLAAATSGQLTDDWRTQKGIKEKWRTALFEDFCDEITVGYVGKMADAYQDKGIPFLRSLNVRPFKFNERDLKYISPKFHQSISKSTLRPGDVVVVRTGAPGQCCVIPPELKEANCSDLVIVRCGVQLLPGFAVVFINSETSQEFVKSERVGVAQSHFNVGSMKKAPLQLPTVAEQAEIVRRVEALFALADRIEARLATAQRLVERLTPATLSKAFRGDLVPQDSKDEPAYLLLERVRTTASPDQKPKRRN